MCRAGSRPALAKAGVIQHIRPKLSCRACDTVVAAPAPDHAIARGRAGAGLLAHVVVSKYDDHLPLYRQAEIFARDGVSLETSTPAFARAGSMFVTSGRLPVRAPRRRCSFTRPIAKGSTRGHI